MVRRSSDRRDLPTGTTRSMRHESRLLSSCASSTNTCTIRCVLVQMFVLPADEDNSLGQAQGSHLPGPAVQSFVPRCALWYKGLYRWPTKMRALESSLWFCTYMMRGFCEFLEHFTRTLCPDSINITDTRT